MRAWVDITFANRPTERHRLKTTGGTLGRHRRASICVRDAIELLPEHVRLMPSADGCEVELLEPQAIAPVYHGRPSAQVTIPWNEEFFVGSVHVRVVRETALAKQERTNPLVVGFVLSAVGLLAYSEYQNSLNLAAAVVPPAPPALAVGDKACKLSGEAASYRAHRAEEQAHARFTRSVFQSSEAPEALALMSEARACFDAGSAPADATRVETVLRHWEDTIRQRYKSLLLKLELASRRSDHEDVLRNVKQLRGLVPTASAYGVWLANHARATELEIARAKQAAIAGGTQ